ncbi:MAG: spore coat U domain-containing protein [Deltaproteobacteria bacterium]|nr:spore coat U domain-containing protein [Deltaproteobacteria bacterium]
MSNFAAKTLLTIAVIFAVMVFIPAPSHAALATTSLNISLSTANTCSVATNPINLGNYSNLQPTENVNTVTNAIVVTCTSGVNYTVDLGQGSNFGLGPQGGRSLKDGGAGTTFLSYRLYWDTAKTQIAGSTIPTGTSKGGVGNGSVQLIELTGVALANQPVTVQAPYADTVTIDVTW